MSNLSINNKTKIVNQLSLEQKRINDNYFKMILSMCNNVYIWTDMKWSIPVVKNKWFLCDMKQYLHFRKIVTDEFFVEAFLLNGLHNKKK
jgi:hypothetical protein